MLQTLLVLFEMLIGLLESVKYPRHGPAHFQEVIQLPLNLLLPASRRRAFSQ